MRTTILALLLTLAVTPALADNIAAKDAAAHAGETATVVGVLSNVHKPDNGKLIQWEIGGTYPDNAFTAVIFKHDMGKFPDMTPMVGKTVAITGKIEMYHDKPEIILKDITQVQIAQ